MDRIEEFTRSGKSFVYIDFSGLKTNEEIAGVVARAKPVIGKYPPKSIYTITNFDGLHYNKESKNIIIPYTEANKPFVIAGAIIGMDGLKRIIANTIFTVSGRKDFTILNTKEEAVQHFINNG